MLGIRVTVPIACFRKGLAREYLETEPLPPPSTCYGFLLSLVGEKDRYQHLGCRVCPVLVNKPAVSVVLRTVWRVKKTPLGSPGNTRPDYQQLLSPVELVVWLDSAGESGRDTLEQRVGRALRRPESVERFGGLCLGESTHLVDEVAPFPRKPDRQGAAFLLADRGRLTMPVWVDHVGSAGTRYVTGDLVQSPLVAPRAAQMPRVASNLPNQDLVAVPENKITGYLLSETHRDGRHKAVFLSRFGFRREQPEVLTNALLRHVAANGVVAIEPSPFGQSHVVEGGLDAPDGRRPMLRSVWFIDTGEDVPRFVTAYPLKGATHD